MAAPGPQHIASTNRGNLKLKVATATVAISSLHLLRIFLQAEGQNEMAVLWHVVIHGVLLVGAVLLGTLNSIDGHRDTAANDETA